MRVRPIAVGVAVAAVSLLSLAAGNGLPAVAQVQGVSFSVLDHLFVAQSSAGGLAEVAFAQLALRRSPDREVRAFSRQVVEDQRQANRKLAVAARQMGITPADAPADRHLDLQQRLGTLSGKGFDRAFLTAMVTELRMDIALAERHAEIGADNPFAALAADRLPRQRAHLIRAERLLARLQKQ